MPDGPLTSMNTMTQKSISDYRNDDVWPLILAVAAPGLYCCRRSRSPVSVPSGCCRAPSSGSSSASPVVRPNGQHIRAGPKRRTGNEGSEEAKIDADQARELYLRRKQRLEQIRAQQQELTKDQRTLATNRARMHARLIETARALRLSEKRLTEIEEHLAQTRAKIKEEREKFEDKSAQMSALVRAFARHEPAAAPGHVHP